MDDRRRQSLEDEEGEIDEEKIKAQVGGLLLVPFYLLILAWIARAFGWWQL